MKKYINLFSQQSTQRKSLVVISSLRGVGFIVMGIIVVVLIIEWSGFFFLSTIIAKQEKVKNQYTQYIANNQNLDQKLQNFLYKYDLLKTYIKDDAELSFYYDLLQTLVTNLNEPAKLTSYSITKTQAVTFNITVDTYENALSVLSAIESTHFTDYFADLELSGFTISSVDNDTFTLQFTGTFKKVQNAKTT